MGKNEESKKFAEFEAGYSEEVKELLVLTSESTGGACSTGDGLWTAGAGFLASVDPQTGELNRKPGELRWLCREKDSKNWIHNVKDLTIYLVKCREGLEKNKDCYMLVDVVKRNLRHPGLDLVLEAYKKPVWLTDELCGKFQLNRRFSWFSGDVDWLDGKCNVSLSCDEDGGETADAAMEVFRKIYGNLEEWDKKFRAFAAEELTELANDWLDEDDWDEETADGEEASGEEDSKAITEEDFARRISISELSVEPDGNYTAYYDDDDMFYGHVILIEGNVETGMEDAEIAG